MRKFKIPLLAAALLVIAVVLPVTAVAAQTDGVTHGDAAAAFYTAAEVLLYEQGVDFAEMLATADFSTAQFVDLMYATYRFYQETGDAPPLDAYAALFIATFVTAYEFGILEAVLLDLVVVVIASEVLGHANANALFRLPLFAQIYTRTGYDAFSLMHRAPYLATILVAHGAEILHMLDFDIYDARALYAETGEIPHGLYVLSYMTNLDVDVISMMREISDADLQLERVNRVLNSIEWDNRPPDAFMQINIDGSYLEERLAFALNPAKRFFVDLYNDLPLAAAEVTQPPRFNLFFRNNSDDYAIFHVVFEGSWMFTTHIGHPAGVTFLVPAGGERTVQLFVPGMHNWLAVAAVSMQGAAVDGEFAIRLTEYPLPQ